jgi:hypothetical protein
MSQESEDLPDIIGALPWKKEAPSDLAERQGCPGSIVNRSGAFFILGLGFEKEFQDESR